MGDFLTFDWKRQTQGWGICLKYGNLPRVRILKLLMAVLMERLFMLFICCFCAMACSMKTVLVSVGDNTRVVSFGRSSASTVDSEALAPAIQAAFNDLLLPGQTFFCK